MCYCNRGVLSVRERECSVYCHLRLSTFWSGCVVDCFSFFLGELYLEVFAGALCYSHPAEANTGLSFSQCSSVNVAPQHWLPTQTNQSNSSRWAVEFEHFALCLCCICSWLGGLQFFKYTIWVMVGIQGRVVAIDFSAFTVQCSKLRPDGRSVSFSSFYLLEGTKDYFSCKFPLTCYASL